MYDLKNVNIYTKADLNSIVSDEQILTFYFGEFELHKLYMSPFREENNPSFVISYYGGRLVCRDFGKSNKPFDVIDFVKEIKSLSGKNLNFKEVLLEIYSDIVISKKIPILKHEYDKRGETLKASIKYSEKWEDYQLDYWVKGNISKNTLDKFNTKWCDEVWFYDRLWSKGSKYNLMYLYNHALTPYDESWTVYRPFATSNKKFRKFNVDGRIMGLDLIPQTGHLLVITKSYKDIMVLYELGIPAIAPHNENIPIPKDIIDDLKKRFELIYVNYDNDVTGIKSCIRFTKEHDLFYWNLPKSLNCKDPFACSCKYGLEAVLDNLNQKIKRDGNL
jgi:hypothetical protein